MKNFKFLALTSFFLPFIFMTSCKDNSLELNPEVTSDWFYSVGQTLEYSRATNAYNLEEPTKGDGLIWDFYDAQGNPQEDLSILDPAGLPGNNYFPQANIAMRDNDSDVITYFQKNSDTLMEVGVYLNSTFHYKYSDPLVVSISPFNFEESFEDQYMYTLYTNGSPSTTSTFHVKTEY